VHVGIVLVNIVVIESLSVAHLSVLSQGYFILVKRVIVVDNWYHLVNVLFLRSHRLKGTRHNTVAVNVPEFALPPSLSVLLILTLLVTIHLIKIISLDLVIHIDISDLFDLFLGILYLLVVHHPHMIRASPNMTFELSKHSSIISFI
jgi:hypothetical protein